jgi:deazaflavin-dependent oxidoreductase (nitroreductase family)
MGTCTDLGYVVPTPNAFQRFMWKVSGSRPGAAFFRVTLHHIDRVLNRLTRGRAMVPRIVAGLPTVMLTTTGSKTGKRRRVPLLGVPVGDDMVVIGTSFGQRQTPAWVYNLAAHPDAELEFNGRTVHVKARELQGDERDAAWEAGRKIYAGYEMYARRITGRTVRVFALEAA